MGEINNLWHRAIVILGLILILVVKLCYSSDKHFVHGIETPILPIAEKRCSLYQTDVGIEEGRNGLWFWLTVNIFDLVGFGEVRV